MEETYRVDFIGGQTVTMTGPAEQLAVLIKMIKTADLNGAGADWIPAAQLPDKDLYGWSRRMIVCLFTPGDRRPTQMTASYDFERQQWRSAMGEVESVTHWQPLPDFPKEYQT